MHFVQFKENASKLSGEMRTDKRANHRNRIDKPRIGGTQLQEFTVNKPYDCLLLCFVEKCRCQAYQMKGKHSCELLDEDRFAASDDFVQKQGYQYYDLSREYEKAVRYYDTNNMMVI